MTSAVHGRHDFATDRGPRALQAWSLQVSDSLGPIVVLDVDEQGRRWQSSLPDGIAGTAQHLGSDGTRLRYRFFGSPREYVAYDGADVAASATAIAFVPRGHDIVPDGPRAAYAQEREVEVQLPEPLGARVLVNGRGCPIAVLAT